MFYKFGSSRFLLTILLGGICITGDLLVELSSHSKLLKAICDNITHACVGFVTTLIILFELEKRISSTEKFWMLFICLIISSLIDIDHFIAARSWKLTNATQLKQRPFLHCTTIPLLALILLLILHKFPNFSTNLWISLIFCAFLSHHTRDATRRGYWIYPFGHTVPLPYFVYIVTMQSIPFVFAYLLNNLKASDHSSPVELITI